MTQSVVDTEHNVVNPVSTDANGDVVTDSSGNPAGNVIVSYPAGDNADGTTTLETFLVAGGASQTGTAQATNGAKTTFAAVANGSSGAFAATVSIMVSNDNTNFITMGTITLSGTATTADVDGFAADANWAYVRADVASFSGTGATCTVTMGG